MRGQGQKVKPLRGGSQSAPREEKIPKVVHSRRLKGHEGGQKTPLGAGRSMRKRRTAKKNGTRWTALDKGKKAGWDGSKRRKGTNELPACRPGK